MDITPEGLRQEGGDVSALVPRVGVPKPKLHLNLRDPEALAADVERCVLCLCLCVGCLRACWLLDEMMVCRDPLLSVHLRPLARACVPVCVCRYRREKEELRRQTKAEQEIQELEGCTFAPHIYRWCCSQHSTLSCLCIWVS